ncbi:MAG: PIN domain protein [bacterium]|nr:PIN domain protein [bacterium]
MKKNRIYADTSVIGGVFDDEFSSASKRFFDEALMGKHIILISVITERELRRAPLQVVQFANNLPRNLVESIDVSKEMVDLTDAYMSSKIVSEKYYDDAAHVAVATVTRADAIISWNFRHMVKLEKIQAFNAVNLNLGYPTITILTPREVISYEKEI